MRRSSASLLLLVLALLSRLLTPLAAEARVFDPLTDAPICLHDGSKPLPGQTNDHPPHHGTCDLICCHVAPPLADNAPVVRGATTKATIVAWHRLTASIVTKRELETHRARGPPTIS